MGGGLEVIDGGGSRKSSPCALQYCLGGVEGEKGGGLREGMGGGLEVIDGGDSRKSSPCALKYWRGRVIGD